MYTNVHKLTNKKPYLVIRQISSTFNNKNAYVVEELISVRVAKDR